MTCEVQKGLQDFALAQFKMWPFFQYLLLGKSLMTIEARLEKRTS